MARRKTRIKSSYIVAFDGHQHRFLRDGELVFEGDTIIYVGKSYSGEADVTIDARDKIVVPGFVCTHSHMAASPMDRSFIEDCGKPEFFFSGLYDSLATKQKAMDQGMRTICFEYSLNELVRTGATTVVEIGTNPRDLVPLAASYGIRVYFAPIYASGRWYSPDEKQIKYYWDEEAGEQGLEKAVSFIREYQGSHDDRIRGLLSPLSADTCTEQLLEKSQEAAHDLGVQLTLHTCQSVIEFTEMLRRHGKTPLAWLHDIGFLQDNVILGHAIIIGGGSWSNYPAGDLAVMSESGCSVAHCPWVFARRGIVMESFYRYQNAGVRMTLGTDTCPQNMIQAMRWAAVLSKIVERNTQATTAADVFNAATIGGAQALGREDLGRICKGAKADIVLFSADTTNMLPMRDAVRNIVYNAEAEDVDTVFVNGEIVMEKGRPFGKASLDKTNRQLQSASERLWVRITDEDPTERTIDDLSPLSFSFWDGESGHS